MNIDLDSLSAIFSAALSHDITKWTVALSIASWIHGHKMKGQFENVIISIDNLSKAFSSLNSRITNIESRVENLEKKGI